MFDSGLRKLKDKASASPAEPLDEYIQQANRRLQRCESQMKPCAIQPPDTYLEGFCDVGPRPIRSPLHLDQGIANEYGLVILEAVLLFNKALAIHSKSDLAAATRAYDEMAIRHAGLCKGAKCTKLKNWLAHMGMLLHNNKGQIIYCKGDEDGALQEFRSALYWARHAVGVSVDRTTFILHLATCMSNYGRTRWMMGIIEEETCHVFDQVLRLRASVLDASHPDVVGAHLNIGMLAYARNDKAAALKHLKSYLSVASKEPLQSESGVHLDPIPAIAYIILIENEEKDDDLSVELLRTVRALLDKREDYGNEHAEVASLLNYVGTILFHRRELKSALLFYKEELRLEERLGASQPGLSLSITFNNIGRILQELGKPRDAMVCYRQALNVEKDKASETGELRDEPSRSTISLFSTIWYNLGIIYDQIGSRLESINAFKMSLELRQRNLGADHSDIACLWYNIGTLQMEHQLVEEATKSFREALRIGKLGGFVEHSRHLMTTLKKLVTLQQQRGKVHDAIFIVGELVEMHRTARDLQELGAAQQTLAELHHSLGNLPTSLSVAHSACESLCTRIATETCSTSAPCYLKSVEDLSNVLFLMASLYNELCDQKQAVELHNKTSMLLSSVLRGASRGTAPKLHTLLEVNTLLANPKHATAA